MTELDRRIGWIGAGRMGVVLAERLLRAGCDVSVYNRTRAKTQPLEVLGAEVVEVPADLSDRDIVVTMIGSTEDLEHVIDGPSGLFTTGSVPGLLVDCSTISIDGSARVRKHALDLGVPMLAAPVSGNPKVALNGMLSIVVSGPRASFDEALPYLQLLGRGVGYVGEGEAARLVKIAHNLLLGVVTQCLAEITVLAERGGVSRAELLAFINDSVMGSTFTRYKSPALVNLDFHPTFTGHLLRKDFEVGLEAGRALDVPLPVTALVHQILTGLVGQGYGDEDFATLLLLEAQNAGIELVSEDAALDDGLHPLDEIARASTEDL